MSFEQYTIDTPGRHWEVIVGTSIEVRERGAYGGVCIDSKGEYQALLRDLRRAAKKLGWEE